MPAASATDIRGKVDFAILTVREDEYLAVLNHLPGRSTFKGNAFYEYRQVPIGPSADCGVAVVRTLEPGHGSAQNTARDLIDDLDPSWILLVGIAGGLPAEEYSLGDVLLASRIYDFSVSAEIQEGEEHTQQWGPTGGSIHPVLESVLAAIPGWTSHMQGWNTEETVGAARPACIVPQDCQDDHFYGPLSHREKVRDTLLHHFPANGKTRPPLYSVGALASGNVLVKDADLAAEWKRLARSYRFIEMEAGGVYRAARRQSREYPVFVIRGLSDVVGFKRAEEWTAYACRSAAAFAMAFIKSGMWGGLLPLRVVAPVAPAQSPSLGAGRQQMTETRSHP